MRKILLIILILSGFIGSSVSAQEVNKEFTEIVVTNTNYYPIYYDLQTKGGEWKKSVNNTKVLKEKIKKVKNIKEKTYDSKKYAIAFEEEIAMANSMKYSCKSEVLKEEEVLEMAKDLNDSIKAKIVLYPTKTSKDYIRSILNIGTYFGKKNFCEDLNKDIDNYVVKLNALKKIPQKPAPIKTKVQTQVSNF